MILEVLLWYNLLSFSMWFGGTIYQMLVIVPLWNRSFFTATGFTRTIHNFFGRRIQAARAGSGKLSTGVLPSPHAG